VKVPLYAVKKHGPTALALVEHVEAGGLQDVGTFRGIIAKSAQVSNQGTAGFWTDGPDGAGLVYRTQDRGYPISDAQPAALTKRCLAIAQAHKAALAQISPDQQLLMGIAGHLEGIAEEIKKRFAA
jgi:hypothetical protein